MLDSLTSVDPEVAYVIVGALALAESLLLLGFLVPGELAVILGGVVASRGHVSPLWMAAVAASGAVLGQAVSFEATRIAGPRLMPFFERGRRERAMTGIRSLMQRYGIWAVILGRFVGYVRPAVPVVAGLSGAGRRSFQLANVVGGVAWATAFTAAGYLAGDAYERFARASGWFGIGVLAVMSGLAVLAWRRRRTAAPEGSSAVQGQSSLISTPPAHGRQRSFFVCRSHSPGVFDSAVTAEENR